MGSSRHWIMSSMTVAYNSPMALPNRRWLAVLLWVLVIYTTIPFVRRLREWFVERWDPALVSWGVAALLVAAAVAALVSLRRRLGGLSTGSLVWMVGTTAVFVLWTFSLKRSPEEAIHLLEYGTLAILLHRALQPSIPNALVFIAAALIGSMIGMVDEVIQWISPSRTWDWRDIVLNAGAGALVQLMLWKIVSAHTRAIDRRSTRLVLRLAAVQLVLLTLCLANTPPRVARYAPLVPGGDRLMSSRNTMAEYGHRFDVPGLGVFRSRLTMEGLADEDATRAVEVATLVDRTRRQYGLFLDTWRVDEDPFTYEVRVHLHARDRNLAKAREQDFSSARAAEQLTTAWYENRLLEKFFGATLEHSSYGWRPALRKRVESAHDPDHHFQSAAGSHLITFASESHLRLFLLALVGTLVLADVAMARYDRGPL